MGIPLIPVAALLMAFSVPGETLRGILIGIYVLLFVWALLDNDYSNLRRIGMDEYRRKL